MITIKFHLALNIGITVNIAYYEYIMLPWKYFIRKNSCFPNHRIPENS